MNSPQTRSGSGQRISNLSKDRSRALTQRIVREMGPVDLQEAVIAQESIPLVLQVRSRSETSLTRTATQLHDISKARDLLRVDLLLLNEVTELVFEQATKLVSNQTPQLQSTP